MTVIKVLGSCAVQCLACFVARQNRGNVQQRGRLQHQGEKLVTLLALLSLCEDLSHKFQWYWEQRKRSAYRIRSACPAKQQSDHQPKPCP
jgi:hypothetical protein